MARNLAKKYLMRLIMIVTMALSLSSIAVAQSSNHLKTTVRGVVTDSVSGEPLSYVNIYLKGTNRGVLTGDDGSFYMVISSDFTCLQLSSMGYESKDVYLKKGRSNNIEIKLSPSNKLLQELVVRPKKEKYSKKNNPAVAFMERLRKNMPLHDPCNNDYFSYDRYEKLILSLNDFALDTTKRINSKFGFISDYIDTSEISGKPILTLSVKEKSSKHLYRSNPKSEKEIVEGIKRAGVDEIFEEESIHKFMNDIFREVDIFQNDVTIMQNRFVSPLSNIASNYYKFYLSDTIPIEGEQCVELSFVPHNSESFGFTGRLYVPLVDTTMFVKKVVLMVPKAINLNYVNSIYMVQNYVKSANGSRLKLSDDITAEFQIMPGTQGLYARRQTAYSNYSFELQHDYLGYYDIEGDIYTREDALMRSDEYWNDSRQIQIKKNEAGIKNLLAELRGVSWFYWVEKGLKILVSGYVEPVKNSKFLIGPVNTAFSVNNAEGARFRVGGLTTAKLNPHLFARGYVAYGTKDEKFKYGGELEYSFNEKTNHSREFPIHSIKLEHNYDIDQIGQHYLFTNKDNFFLSLKRKTDDKVTYRRLSQFTYKMERRSGFSFDIGFRHEIQEATQWLPFEDGYGNMYRDFSQAAFKVTLRYAPGELFYQTISDRIPINLDAPVIQLTHEYGPKGLLGSDFTVNRTEFSLQKRIWFSAFGYTDIILKAGKVWSQVYYPALMWPNANLSYTIQPESYSLMNAMEFANDQYISWDLTYWANGALFNRIPLLQDLHLREVVTFRGLYGKLSDKNNPDINNNLYRFPFDAFAQPMKKTPYMEIGVGIDNIFSFLRVDYVWRLTYRDTPNVDKSGLRIALHFTF